jgi:hypothetical protein
MKKEALAKLLQLEELERKIEGDVYTVEDRRATFAGVEPRPDGRELRETDIPEDVRRLRKPKSATGAKRKRIKNLQKTLRRRMGGA